MSENTELVTKNEPANELVEQLPVFAPAFDVFENDEEILVHADMPGVLRQDIAINIDNGAMTLSGLRRFTSSGTAAWQELAEVEFRRTFAVPQSIDIAKVHAELNEGVLRLHLPKSEDAKPRQIEIKIG